MTLSDIILVVDIDKKKLVWINDNENLSKELPDLPRNEKKNLFKDLDLLLSNFIEKEKKRKENIKKKRFNMVSYKFSYRKCRL